MLWMNSLFLGSPVFAAMEGTISLYETDSCGGTLYLSYTEDGYDSCAEWLSELVEDCDDSNRADPCDNLDAFPLCRPSDEPWMEDAYYDYVYVDESIKFECVDTSDSPTRSPTDATCDDNRENGLEEGVDCGGPCPLACPVSCNTFVCGASHYLRDSPEDIYCQTDVCNTNDDLNTCCIAKALCSTISACPTNEALIAESDSTYCAEDVCDYSTDKSVCCTTADNCDGFTLCDSVTQYLKESPESYYCNSVVCDAADISICCKDKAACTTYACGLGLTKRANPEDIYCAYDDCLDDSEAASTCCEDRESCTAYTCPDYQYVDAADKDDVWCQYATCTDTDYSYCCEEKARCKTDFTSTTYTCSDNAAFPLSQRADNLFCDGLECQSPRDDAFCCIEDVPTLAPTPYPSTSPPSTTPTPAPTTNMPSPAPTTPIPSPAPTTPIPSPAPTTPMPTSVPSPVPTQTPGWTSPPTPTPTTPAPSAAPVEVEDCHQYDDNIESTNSATWEAVWMAGECLDVYSMGNEVATFFGIPCSWVTMTASASEHSDWTVGGISYWKSSVNETYVIKYTDENIADDLGTDRILEELRSAADDSLGCDGDLQLMSKSLMESPKTDTGGDSGISTAVIVIIVVAIVIFIAVISFVVYKLSTKSKKTMGQLVEM